MTIMKNLNRLKGNDALKFMIVDDSWWSKESNHQLLSTVIYYHVRHEGVLLSS